MTAFSQKTRELLAKRCRKEMEAHLSTLLPKGSPRQVTGGEQQWTPERVRATLDELCRWIPEVPISAEEARKRNFLGGVSKKDADAFMVRIRRLEDALVSLDEAVMALRGPGPGALPSDARLLSMEVVASQVVAHLHAQGQGASIALDPEVEAKALVQEKQMEEDFTANLALISAAAKRTREPLGLLREAQSSAKTRGRPENRAQKLRAVLVLATLEELGVPSDLHVKLFDGVLTASFESRPSVDDLFQWAKEFLKARPRSEKPSQRI